MKMLDRKFNLGLSEEQENASETQNRDRKRRLPKRYPSFYAVKVR